MIKSTYQLIPNNFKCSICDKCNSVNHVFQSEISVYLDSMILRTKNHFWLVKVYSFPYLTPTAIYIMNQNKKYSYNVSILSSNVSFTDWSECEIQRSRI
jgi:hypothetical protein